MSYFIQQATPGMVNTDIEIITDLATNPNLIIAWVWTNIHIAAIAIVKDILAH